MIAPIVSLQNARVMCEYIRHMSFRCVECRKTQYSWIGSVATWQGRTCAGCAKVAK